MNSDFIFRRQRTGCPCSVTKIVGVPDTSSTFVGRFTAITWPSVNRGFGIHIGETFRYWPFVVIYLLVVWNALFNILGVLCLIIIIILIIILIMHLFSNIA